MNRGTLGRIEKIERSKVKAVPSLWVWKEDDGTLSYDGKSWPSVDAIIEAFPGSSVTLCSWESDTWGMTHEDALKFLD